MTDLFLGVVVIGAVIAFGALISIGNERQRRAIDGLHEAYKQWAVQDLRLKRGTVISQIQIDDITAWLTRAAGQAFGRKFIVMDPQIHQSPLTTLEFHDAETGNTVVCITESPDTLFNLLKKRRSVLRGELDSNPVFRISRKTPVVELSLLNAGALFDLELPVVWNTMTGEVTKSGSLWAYTLN